MTEMITIGLKQFFDYANSIEVYEKVKNKNGKTSKKRILLDVVDFSLFDYLFYVYNSNLDFKSEKLKKVDEIYVQLSYQKIIDDNPQLRINNKRAMARRLRKLEKFGLIKIFTNKEEGCKTYFKIPNKTFEYFNTK